MTRRSLPVTTASRRALPGALQGSARLRARHDLNPLAALATVGALGVLLAADAAWAKDVAVTVEESASFDVVVTVSADQAPTFQVFTLPGEPHRFVVELPGQRLTSGPVAAGGAGVLLIDAHLEASKKAAPARVVLAFADDVDYDAATRGDSLVVTFAHTGDPRFLFAAAEKRRAERLVAQQRELDAKQQQEAAALERQRIEADRLAALLRDKRLADEARLAELEKKRLAEEERRLAVEKKKLEEEQQRLAAIEARRKAEEDKKLAAEKVKQEAEAKRLAALEAKKKAEEDRKVAAEKKRLEAEQKRLAALDEQRRAEELARLAAAEAKKAAAEKVAAAKAEAARVASEADAKKKAEAEQKKLAIQEAKQKKIDAERLAVEQAARERADAEARRIAALEIEREARRKADDERRALEAAERQRADAAALQARQQEEERVIRETEARRAEAARQLQEQRRLDEERLAAARRAAEQERREHERALEGARTVSSGAAHNPGYSQGYNPGSRSDGEPGFGGAPTPKPVGRAAPAREVRSRDLGGAPGSIDLMPPSHYERYVPPPDADDSGWGDEDTSELDERDGKSVLTQVLVQRVGDKNRVGVKIDGGARYNVERRGTELSLVLFNTRPANFDVRRALDARGLGGNVLRVVPSVEEDERYRVELIIEMLRKAPVKLGQEDGILWLTIGDG